MSRNMRVEVLWAIRDSRRLCAQEKALLWAIESRGAHYGTWQTVAADAGVKRDAYYRWRGRLEDKGVLSVTERPGTTTIHEVNADWFALDAIPANANDLSENPAHTITANRNNLSGNHVMKEDYEGDPVRGPIKTTSNLKTRLIRASDIPDPEPFIVTEQDCAPISAWDQVEPRRPQTVRGNI